MDTTAFKRIAVAGAIIAVTVGGFFIFNLILVHDYSWQFGSDYMPGIVLGTASICFLLALSIFVAVSFNKVIKAFQSEISLLRTRIADLERKTEKK